AVEPAVLLDVVERDVAVALDERHHEPRELLGVDASVDGLALGLRVLLGLLRVGVAELVLEDAHLLLLLGGALAVGRRGGERLAQITEGDLRELPPKAARVQEVDELAEAHGAGVLEPLEGLERAQTLELSRGAA